ncbi:MAG: aminotransferase class V-fold PLP-dependent enzyme [candidate division Zixibacteria bacterium]|nr:aminotransferase class V-fold PLP-dependent enzyme [candidate division Zixibacteria bacterium]
MNSAIYKKFQAIRKLFPLTHKNAGMVYLNSASTGPLCKPVKEALDKYFDLCQYLDKDDDDLAFADLKKIRRLGAKMLDARVDEVGFGLNTGYGINLAAQGLPLKKGDEVLISEVEFPANVYPWLALKEKGIKVKFIKATNKNFDIGNFENAITKKSRVLSLSMVQFFNGYKNDLKTIGEICRKNNLYFVVDGIQGCGVEPISVKKCNIDIFSSGGQKWLLGQLGSGIFYIRKDLQNKMSQPLTSWQGVDWDLDFSNLFCYDKKPFDSARRFEFGTYPYAQVHALAQSLELITSLGVSNIRKHNYELLDILISFLKSNMNFQINSHLRNIFRSSILAFSCNNTKLLYEKLRKNNIFCSFREGSIRISVHLFNNESDIRYLMTVLKKFAK